MLKEKLLYKLGKLLVRGYCFLAFKLDIERKEELPWGPKIYVANHPSTTDPFLTLFLVKEPVSILIKGNIFEIPIFGAYLKHADHVPVFEGSGAVAFQRAREILQKGKSIVLFVEGDISPSENSYHKPKTGAARLALETGLPIVPIGFSLAHKNIKHLKSAYWYFTGPYSITIGRPMFVKKKVDCANVHAVSQQIMSEVVGLVKESKKRLANNFMPGHHYLNSFITQVILIVNFFHRF